MLDLFFFERASLPNASDDLLVFVLEFLDSLLKLFKLLSQISLSTAGRLWIAIINHQQYF